MVQLLVELLDIHLDMVRVLKVDHQIHILYLVVIMVLMDTVELLVGMV